MRNQGRSSSAERLSRRSVLATLSGGAVVGLAGCSGGGDDTPTPTFPPETTGTPEGSDELDIPGEVVHDGIDTLEVLSHGAYPAASTEMNFRVRVRNDGDQRLVPGAFAGTENPMYVRGRTLSDGGNQLAVAKVDSGADEIDPGTEVTLVSTAPVERSRVAEYELCVLSVDPGRIRTSSDWEDACSG